MEVWCHLSLLHSEWPKLCGVLAVLSAIELTNKAPKNAETNFTLAKYKKKFVDNRVNSVDSDEVAHNEPPHLDLPCLQI